MALVPHLGKLCVAQALNTNTTDISDYVIDLSAMGIDGPQPACEMYLDIETVVAPAAGGTADSYTLELVLDDTEACSSVVYRVLTIIMLHGDPRLALGAKIWSGQLPGDQIRMLARATTTPGYRYMALISTLADSGGTTGLTINASVNLGRPQTAHDVQVMTSNVSVPS